MWVNNMITLHIPGVARPKQSARFMNGRVIPVEATNRLLKLWGMSVAQACRRALDAGAEPIPGAVSIDVQFFFPTNKAERWGKPHTQRPDIDNLTKGLYDYLKKNKILAGDDCTIAGGENLKMWAKDAGTVLTIRPFGSPRTLEADQEDDIGVAFTID